VTAYSLPLVVEDLGWPRDCSAPLVPGPDKNLAKDISLQSDPVSVTRSVNSKRDDGQLFYAKLFRTLEGNHSVRVSEYQISSAAEI